MAEAVVGAGFAFHVEMTSQNANLRICLLSLLAVASIVHPASGGSRHDDSSEIVSHSPLNTTKQWSQTLVSAANPVEEGILNSERNRETSGSKIRAKTENLPIDERATPEPEEEFYENVNTAEESPPLEDDILNLERNRESVFNDNLDSLPFQEPSDTDFLTKTKEYLNAELEKQINATSSLGNSPIEEGILDAERDRDETLSDIFRNRNSNEENKKFVNEYKTELSDKETENSNDEPKFEFLIGMPLENFTGQSAGKDLGEEGHTRRPFIPPKSAWPVPQAQSLTADPKNNISSSSVSADGVQSENPDGNKQQGFLEDYVELVEVKNGNADLVNKSGAVTFVPHVNGTGFFLENDAPDSSFTDVQTVFLACFGTLMPLLLLLGLYFGLRAAWRKYNRTRRGAGYEGGLRGGSADPLPDKQRPHSPNSQVKSAESRFSGENCGAGENGREGGPTSQCQPPANGSIITMTLKNNHLIVETEVRNDIARGARETKMKYSPNNDGVFVVEVQQSSDDQSQFRRSPEQRALVHRSPLLPHASVDTDEEADYMHSLLDASPNTKGSDQRTDKKSLGNSNTGLSTSDLSISSAGSQNPSYAYGNQVGYEHGRYGYPVYAGYIPPPKNALPCESSREPLISKTPTDPDKPVVTAAIFKQDSIIAGDEVIKTSGYNIEGSTDGPLLSDIQAREVSLHKLQDKLENGPKTRIVANSDSVHSSDTDEERYQEQQRQLGNGTVRKEQTVVEINHDKSNQCLHRADSLPPRLIEEELQKNGTTTEGNLKNGNNDDGFDTIEEESSMDCYPGDIASGSPLLGSAMAAAGARSKRASLPNITPDLYTSIKQTTKHILPNVSPKFEKFSNEGSPLESILEKHGLPPPLITVTEEAEGSCSGDNDVTPS